jgi:protoporphyrinogen oxidase
VETGADPEVVDLEKREVVVSGERIRFRYLVSTIPLPELVRRMKGAPAEIAEAAAKLRCTPVRYLNVATRRPVKADFHWIYVPEEKYPFYRVGIYTNAVPSMAPRGLGSLYVELSDRGPMPDKKQKRTLTADVLGALVAAGAIERKSDVLFADLHEIEYAYVVFDHAYYEATGKILRFCEAQGIYSRGRYGSWTYNAMEDCILAGRDVATLCTERLASQARTQAPAQPNVAKVVA